MSLVYSRNKILHRVNTKLVGSKAIMLDNVKYNAATPTAIPYIAAAQSFPIPHARVSSIVAKKYIFMPGTIEKAVPVNSIPGYSVHQATIGPVAEMIQMAKYHKIKYGVYAMQREMNQPNYELTPKMLKRQQKAYKKLDKIATKVKKRGKVSWEELINAESQLGSTIFGVVPEGHRREFFHDRKNVWIWHEGWLDESARPHQFTVRYEVRPSGVYKKLSAGRYVQLRDDELENFRHAAHAYLRIVKSRLYAGI